MTEKLIILINLIIPRRRSCCDPTRRQSNAMPRPEQKHWPRCTDRWFTRCIKPKPLLISWVNRSKYDKQEEVWNIVVLFAVHEMLCLAKTDVAWKRRANQSQLSVKQVYNTKIQFRVRGKFSFKRSFTLSRPVITNQKLGPGELIVHGLNLACKKCTWTIVWFVCNGVVTTKYVRLNLILLEGGDNWAEII